MIEGFKGFMIESTVILVPPSLSVTAEMVRSTLSGRGCSGVGGPDSPRTAIVGRNSDAMTILWFRKEDMDDCWGRK